MNPTLRRILQQPLLHFLLLGGALFALPHSQPEQATAEHIINIDADTLQWLTQSSEKERGQTPGPESIDQLVDHYVQEEVLFREALALGLEQNDVVVRRRLIEKMRFLIEDVALSDSPDPSALKTHYRKNPTQFMEPERFSFSHVYFPQDQSQAAENAAQALSSPENKASSLSHQGAPFMLGQHFAEQTRAQLANQFGSGFAAQISNLPLSQWQGPIASVYGWHLIKLEQRQPERLPDFAEIKPEVLEHWQQQRREKANRAAYQRLRAHYRINRLAEVTP